MTEEMTIQESLTQIQNRLDEMEDGTAKAIITIGAATVITAFGAIWITGKVIDWKVARKVKQQQKKEK